MTVFRRIAALKVQNNPQANRIAIEWQHPSGPNVGEWASYFINENTLKKYDTPEELRAALDLFTMNNWGYVFDDIWFHLNDDGVTWAVATGQEPAVWPEDEIEL